jgi:hypothetical protein
MSKEQMDSIIKANLYFVRCKFDINCSKRTECARKYLNLKISKILSKKEKKEKVSYLSLFSFLFPFFG